MDDNSISEQLFGSEYKQELIKLMHPDWNVDFYRDENGKIKIGFGAEDKKEK